MYFYKFDHPMNFISPGDGDVSFECESLGADVFRYRARGERWTGNPAVVELDTEAFSKTGGSAALNVASPPNHSSNGGLRLTAPGSGVLETTEHMPFGVNGSRWLVRFPIQENDLFYGMGAKNNGFEKSGIRTKFWNTDVWAEFATEQIDTGVTDPMYISVPYLMLHRGKSWFGLLVNNPFPVFMNTGAAQVIEGIQETEAGRKEFFLGSTDGEPDVFIIAGDNPKDVTRKLFTLTGKSPRPPLWALGYHQSRWGYACDEDLLEIDKNLTAHDIPCDGIWMDIDYMDGYRVFTIDQARFGNLEQTLETISDNGRRVVPILDPGVKADPEYRICTEGLEQNLFCITGESTPYVGFVWPGATYFPDFSKVETRNWWADETRNLTMKGFGAYWVDMNDPSTGSAEVSDMRFNDGKDNHEAWHNQYALLMQQATWKGLEEAKPEERPFLLSRSASTGSNRYGAVWTGDNISNWHHLRKSVEMALNLSLSGMAFFGADVGGFGGDAEDENYMAWYKALFLFPFFRNHCADGQKNQEPWMMGTEALDTARQYIKARYALLPYLYNLFIEQEESGSPIIAPLLYLFDDYPYVDDQFMVGDFIMQAPMLSPGRSRQIEVPEGRWYDVCRENWVDGPTTLDYTVGDDETPVFVREGAIIPIRKNGRSEGGLDEIDFLCFIDSETGDCSSTYRFDKGNGFAYREHGDGRVSVSIAASRNNVAIEASLTGPGTAGFEGRFFVVGYSSDKKEPEVEIPFAGTVLKGRAIESD